MGIVGDAGPAAAIPANCGTPVSNGYKVAVAGAANARDGSVDAGKRLGKGVAARERGAVVADDGAACSDGNHVRGRATPDAVHGNLRCVGDGHERGAVPAHEDALAQRGIFVHGVCKLDVTDGVNLAAHAPYAVDCITV